MKRDVIVVIGAGGIGLAIARVQSFGKTLLLADYNEQALQAAAENLRAASYLVETQVVDVSSRESVKSLVETASALGSVVQVINTAGVSPNMAPPERVLAVDLYGSAVVFEEFERRHCTRWCRAHYLKHGRPYDARADTRAGSCACFHAGRQIAGPPFSVPGCDPQFDDRLYDGQTSQ